MHEPATQVGAVHDLAHLITRLLFCSMLKHQIISGHSISYYVVYVRSSSWHHIVACHSLHSLPYQISSLEICCCRGGLLVSVRAAMLQPHTVPCVLLGCVVRVTSLRYAVGLCCICYQICCWVVLHLLPDMLLGCVTVVTRYAVGLRYSCYKICCGAAHMLHANALAAAFSPAVTLHQQTMLREAACRITGVPSAEHVSFCYSLL